MCRLQNTVFPRSPVAEVVRLLGTYANAQTLTDQPAVGAPATTTIRLMPNWEVLKYRADGTRSVPATINTQLLLRNGALGMKGLLYRGSAEILLLVLLGSG